MAHAGPVFLKGGDVFNVKSAELPAELQAHKKLVDAYVQSKISEFVGFLTQKLSDDLDCCDLKRVVAVSQEYLHGERPEADKLASFSQSLLLTQSLCVAINIDVSEAQIQTLQALTQKAAAPSRVPARSLSLRLHHDCQSTGCSSQACALCRLNPSRPCDRHLKRKYLIKDELRAKCSGDIRVEVVDSSGARVLEEAWPGSRIEVLVINGKVYKDKCGGSRGDVQLSMQDLEQCILPNQKTILESVGGKSKKNQSMPSDRVIFHLENGQVPLRNLYVQGSSEALLSCKDASLHLLVRPVDLQGEPIQTVQCIVSEPFSVATQRVKKAIKSDIPVVTEHVSKLEHIGRKTVQKLIDLRGSVSGLPASMGRIETVRDFQSLLAACKGQVSVQDQVMKALKLSPTKWDEVCAHAAKAVEEDFIPRVWWCPGTGAGLLFPCHVGRVNLGTVAAWVQSSKDDVTDDEVVSVQELDAATLNLITDYKKQAASCWSAPGHPGWAIYWPDGQYKPMQFVRRMCQVAANEYAASTKGRSTARDSVSKDTKAAQLTSATHAASATAAAPPPSAPLRSGNSIASSAAATSSPVALAAAPSWRALLSVTAAPLQPSLQIEPLTGTDTAFRERQVSSNSSTPTVFQAGGSSSQALGHQAGGLLQAGSPLQQALQLGTLRKFLQGASSHHHQDGGGGLLEREQVWLPVNLQVPFSQQQQQQQRGENSSMGPADLLRSLSPALASYGQPQLSERSAGLTDRSDLCCSSLSTRERSPSDLVSSRHTTGGAATSFTPERDGSAAACLAPPLDLSCAGPSTANDGRKRGRDDEQADLACDPGAAYSGRRRSGGGNDGDGQRVQSAVHAAGHAGPSPTQQAVGSH